METSKATVCYINQVASDTQAAQINLIIHQQTDLPPGKNNKKQKSFKSRPSSHKRYSSENNQHQVPPFKKKFDPNQAHSIKDRSSKCGDSKHIEGFKCPARKFQCKTCKNMDILPASVTRKNQFLSSPEHPRGISNKLDRYTY